MADSRVSGLRHTNWPCAQIVECCDHAHGLQAIFAVRQRLPAFTDGCRELLPLGLPREIRAWVFHGLHFGRAAFRLAFADLQPLDP